MKRFYFIFFLSIHFLYGQVGVNTTDPKEALHLAGDTGTLRVETLNGLYNDYNPGDLEGDGNDDNTVPLYVDENGDFTLQLDVLENSGSEDWIVPTFAQIVTLAESNSSGCVDAVIETFVIEDISRPTLLQVKYNISHEIFSVFSSGQKVSISDGLARRVDNFIRVTPDPDPTDNISNREYGTSSRTYTSNSINSVQGPFYNGHTTYIKLIPAPNTTQDFTLEIWGRLCSNLTTGGDSLLTRLSFAVDFDFLFLKLH